MIQQVSALGLQELEAGVAKLPPGELLAFSRWFEEFRASAWNDPNDIASSDETERDVEELSAEDMADLPPLSQEWIDEINRRSREIDEGTAVLIPHDTVMQQLRKMIKVES